MSNVIKMEDVQKLIVELRGQQVLVDADVAQIYGVETKEINRAVSNNPDKFPTGYVLKTTDEEFNDLRRKFSTAKFAKTRVNPKAFTEKGMYMLATIPKSKQAAQTTLMIIETFAKIRELTRTINSLSVVKNENEKQGLCRQEDGERPGSWCRVLGGRRGRKDEVGNQETVNGEPCFSQRALRSIAEPKQNTPVLSLTDYY